MVELTRIFEWKSLLITLYHINYVYNYYNNIFYRIIVLFRNTSGSNTLLCVAQCNCNTSQYEPVCGADGFTYASPCNAGCTIRNLTDPDVSDFNTMTYNWPTKWYNVSYNQCLYWSLFMQNPVFLDCGCVMENLTQSMSALHGLSGEMSLDGSLNIDNYYNSFLAKFEVFCTNNVHNQEMMLQTRQ